MNCSGVGQPQVHRDVVYVHQRDGAGVCDGRNTISNRTLNNFNILNFYIPDGQHDQEDLLCAGGGEAGGYGR